MITSDKPFSPPVELKIAGWLILLQFVSIVILTIFANQTGLSDFSIRLIAVSINCLACVYLGIAAKKLGKSWLLYGLLPALGMVFIFSFYSLYKLKFDAWVMWADKHATYIPDKSA